jgi:hypothetical protein
MTVKGSTCNNQDLSCRIMSARFSSSAKILKAVTLSEVKGLVFSSDFSLCSE